MSVDLSQFYDYLNGTDSPLLRKPCSVDNSDLTERKVDGCGTFDVLMSSVYAHLRTEFDKNRITGAEYTKAYIALTESVISNSVQFLLQKETSYWQAVAGQLEVVKTAKAIEEIEQNIINKTKEALILDEQRKLVKEQMESQLAQTLDVRTDSAAVSGLIKTQKDLYKQQIDSYKRDAETKVGKLLIDTWTTQKTVDEGLTAPTQVSNANLDTLISALRSRNTI
ncbi:MAG: hypothetical protein LC099_12415 [Anaerolineales bacterium]|nr:hypothetical protein [Anaerolineales bacterium]